MRKSTFPVQNLVMPKHPHDLHTIVVIIFLCEDTIQTTTIITFLYHWLSQK